MNFQTEKEDSELKFLNGLRGIAILMVMSFHLFNFHFLFRAGWLGVNLFFVLSGFLITNILLKVKLNYENIKKFVIRRMLRIFPVYYMMLFIVFVLGNKYFSQTLPNFDKLLSNQLYFWTYLQNYFYIYNSNEISSFLNHLWSLSIEEHYYLIWPFFIKWFEKHLNFLIAAIVAVFLLRFFSSNETASYVATHLRVDGLLLGSTIAISIKQYNGITFQLWKKIIGLMVLAMIAILIIDPSISPVSNIYTQYGYSVFEIISALLIYGLLQFNDKLKTVKDFLEQKIFIFFGKYSYGLYLIHWPIYIWAKYNVDVQESIVFSISRSILVMGLSLILAVLSYEFFESRFIALKSKFSYS